MSYLHVRLSLLLHRFRPVTITWLRYLNFHIGAVFLPFQVAEILELLVDESRNESGQYRTRRTAENEPTDSSLGHTAVNICLFPLLFFFYALYYTDVISTLSVLFVYRFCLKRQRLRLLLAGLVSLWFRQTNIFWVTIFMGGLDLTRSIRQADCQTGYVDQPTLKGIVIGSWHKGCLYDIHASRANILGRTFSMELSYANREFCRLHQDNPLVHSCRVFQAWKGRPDFMALHKSPSCFWFLCGLERWRRSW